MEYQRLSQDQRRAYLDNAQLWDAYLDAQSQAYRCRGGMRWRSIQDKDYLYRVMDSRVSRGLGPRSEATERAYATFSAEKAQSAQRVTSLENQVHRQSRICRAMDLGQLPRLSAKILRSLTKVGLDRKTLTVVGTHALFAYEALAGAFFPSPLLAIRDIDLLWDARLRLKIASEIPPQGLIALLKKVDRSFAVLKGSPFRVVNDEGFMVDLLQGSADMRVASVPSFATEDDFVAAEADLRWLISSRHVRATVLDENGVPAIMVAPDPRAFALHKSWLAERVNRDPVKKERDAAQSVAVARLVRDLLPQYPFSDAALRMFPRTLRDRFLTSSPA